MPKAKDPRLERVGVEGFNKYKVYLHRRASDESVFYVGKGNRWRENSKAGRNKHWHHTVAKHGLIVEIVARDLTNEEACNMERKLISNYGIDNLVNYTLGGEGSEGYKHTQEAIQKMQGRVLSESHKQKLSQSKLKKPSMFWSGKTRPEETVLKMSEALSKPSRKMVKDMLLMGFSRKEIQEKTAESFAYIRQIASYLRGKGYEIPRLQN